MNIQDKMQEIHHKFGVTEKANYEIQLFVDDLIKKDRAEQLILHGVTYQLFYQSEELGMANGSDKNLFTISLNISGIISGAEWVAPGIIQS